MGLANENVTLLSIVTQVLNFQQCFTKCLHDGQSSCEIKTHQKCILGNSLIVLWLGLHAPLWWAWVQTLVWELRSQKPCGMIKKKIVCVYVYVLLLCVLRFFSLLSHNKQLLLQVARFTVIGKHTHN